MPRRTVLLLVSALVTGMLSVSGAQAAVTVEDGTIGSFDGTLINYSLAHPDGVTPSPVIFMGHGWGGSRNKNWTGGLAKTLLDNGFAVLSWDARGFGTSGGEANVDSQEYEVKDVQALIDEVANKSTILLDGARDPRMGMVGSSYGGGIQLMTASADSRVDAIVPDIAWNSLTRSLKPNGVIKLGWDTALYGLGVATGTANGLPAKETGSVAPQIHIALAEAAALNDWSTSTWNWFDGKSPKHYVNGNTVGGRNLPGVRVPTLITQGLSDTLFNFNEGLANYQAIAANGVPVKLIAYCGGHTITPLGSACSSTGASAKVSAATLAWLTKYVKGDGSVNTGAAIEYQLQDGTFESTSALQAHNVTMSDRTVLTNTIAPTTGQGFAGTSGGCRPPTADERGKGPGGLTPSREYVAENPYCAASWMEVALLGDYIDLPSCKVPGEVVGGHLPICDRENYHLPAGSKIVGVPRVEIQATGIGTEAYAFFKLVDYDTVTKKKTVIGDQVTPYKFTGLGNIQPQYATFDLAGVAWEVKAGHEIYLEASPTSNDYASSRVPGSVSMEIKMTLPVSHVQSFTTTPSSFSFGTRAVGPTHTTVAGLTSTGTAPVTVNSMTITGANASEFSLVEDGCTAGVFSVGQKCSVKVGFSPTSAGAKAATLTFNTSAGTSTVALSGTGALLPFNTVSPGAVAFGDQVVNTSSAPVTLTVTNAGSATMNITTTAIAGTNSGDFTKSADTCAGTSLAPGASCTLNVTFKPAAAGARSGRITVNSNGGNVRVDFTGTGVAAP
jgi:ABC-2 type transport system ATP-binding protein